MITMGSNVRINNGVFINQSTNAEILIGSDVLIGPYCVMRSADHVFSNRDALIREQGHAGSPIVIDDDVWLASQVTVLKGVHIGRGTVIGAHSVVTGDIEAYSVAFGAPARVHRKRGEPSI